MLTHVNATVTGATVKFAAVQSRLCVGTTVLRIIAAHSLVIASAYSVSAGCTRMSRSKWRVLA